MFSGIEKVSVHVLVLPVLFRCQNGASILDDLKEDVYLSLGICDEVIRGALLEHSE